MEENLFSVNKCIQNYNMAPYYSKHLFVANTAYEY
jgi:hypothetical protein